MRRLAFGLLLLALLALIWPPGAGAAGGIQVVENRHTSVFAQEIVFSLVAESASPIHRVALYRQLEGGLVRARAEVAVAPATRVEAEHVWELEAGELAPGTRLAYYWLLEDGAGDTLVTDPVTFVYVDDRFQWQRLSQEWITVQFYGSGRSQAEDVLQAAWEAAQRLSEDIGVIPEKEITVYIYNSQREMQAALSPRGSIYDARTITLGVAAGDDTLLVLGSHPDVSRTVAHEMSHIVVGLATDNPYTSLPRWLDEGLAMYAEGPLPPGHARTLERAIRQDRLISVRSLSSYVGDPDQVDLFYAETYSVVTFMLDAYGKDRMVQLLREFSQGVLAEEALQAAYGLGLDELEDQWRASLGLGPRSQEAQAPAPAQRAPLCLSPMVGAAVAMIGLAVVSRRAGGCHA